MFYNECQSPFILKAGWLVLIWEQYHSSGWQFFYIYVSHYKSFFPYVWLTHKREILQHKYPMFVKHTFGHLIGFYEVLGAPIKSWIKFAMHWILGCFAQKKWHLFIINWCVVDFFCFFSWSNTTSLNTVRSPSQVPCLCSGETCTRKPSLKKSIEFDFCFFLSNGETGSQVDCW